MFGYVTLQTALRVWDCLFYEGSKILIRVALTLLILNKDKFLESKDFTGICAVFKVISRTILTAYYIYFY